MPIQKTHISALCVAALLACALPALAQNLPGIDVLNDVLDQVQQAETLPEDRVENRYRIGIDCAPAPEALRVHLRLEDEIGLLVNSVLDDSPGGRAGLKRHDVIVAANGTPLTTTYDLIVAVNRAKESEMKLSVISVGEEKTVTLVPEERDAEEIERLRNGLANQIGQQPMLPGLPGFGGKGLNLQGLQGLDLQGLDLQGLQGMDLGDLQGSVEQMVEQMQRQLGGGFGGGFGPMNRGWRRMGPGIMLDDLQKALPNSATGQSWSSSKTTRRFPMPNGEQVSITVERNGGEKANIKITRGSETWELTESDLDQLPEDLRPLAESQLNGSGTIQGLMAPFRRNSQPPQRRSQRRNDDRLKDRFDGLELKMQELQDAIRSIQGEK